MQTVVETPPYLANAESLFTAEERTAIIDTVAADPHCGVVIPGSNGIRKVLLAAFAKNQKSDLTPKERLALGKSVGEMLANYRRKR